MPKSPRSLIRQRSRTERQLSAHFLPSSVTCSKQPLYLYEPVTPMCFLAWARSSQLRLAAECCRRVEFATSWRICLQPSSLPAPKPLSAHGVRGGANTASQPTFLCKACASTFFRASEGALGLIFPLASMVT
jgi:hypothetical protein